MQQTEKEALTLCIVGDVAGTWYNMHVKIE